MSLFQQSWFSMDKEMGCQFLSSYFLLKWGIDLGWATCTLDWIDWRRAVLCCSCVMAQNVSVIRSCKNFHNMLIMHSRNRSVMRDIVHGGKDGWNEEDKGVNRKTRVQVHAQLVGRQVYAWLPQRKNTLVSFSVFVLAKSCGGELV